MSVSGSGFAAQRHRISSIRIMYYIAASWGVGYFWYFLVAEGQKVEGNQHGKLRLDRIPSRPPHGEHQFSSDYL